MATVQTGLIAIAECLGDFILEISSNTPVSAGSRLRLESRLISCGTLQATLGPTQRPGMAVVDLSCEYTTL
jgi:hypothetical protein